MTKHAVLSPSKSSMWINCPPSARLNEKFDRKSGEAADEGTLAHSLGELLLKRALERVKEKEFIAQVKGIKANTLYNSAMMEHCTRFASYVMEQYNAMLEKYDNVVIILEAELDLSKYIPEGFGTGDVIICGGTEVLVIDFKYGKGVYVETEGNSQMMIYALGAIILVELLSFVAKKVKMTIYQPRLDNINSWDITVKDLTEWANDVLKGRAKLAFAGEGKLAAGSHCLFCRIKATCKAHAKYNLELAGEEFDEHSDATQLPDKKLVELYLRAKQIRSWLGAIEDYMLEEAVKGKTWKGLKLVHGRSVRILTKPDEIVKVFKRMKLPEKHYLSEPQLLGITALEANIGVKLFAEMVGKYVIKPTGKPSLVHAENKGKDYDVNNSAAEDFS